MPRRVIVFAMIGAALVAAAGYLAYARVAGLQERVADLDRQLAETEQRLEQTEASADAAARAATDAEARAREATRRADDSDSRAAQALEEAGAAEREARAADTGRRLAERAQAAAEVESDNARDQARRARDAELAAVQEALLARQEAAEIRRRREAELNRLQEALTNIVETRRTAIGLVLNLGSDRVEFDFDRATLRAREREFLARIAGVLIASADQGYAIQVFGHTDDVGSDDYNLALSERRAQAVRDYLVEAGVRPEILSTQGVGKSMPLVDGTDDAARARNRRVEIAIIDTLIEFKPARR